MAQLITGDDLMKEFDLASSPIVGKLLKSIRKAQFDGKIKTRQEALELAKKTLRQYSNNRTDEH